MDKTNPKHYRDAAITLEPMRSPSGSANTSP